MASSSSPRTWRYRVFTSFHGPDVRKTFLSHLRKQFNCHGITMFDDQGIERSQTIAHALTRAIRESRISIVILSKKYASSKWCLDELAEILECKRASRQILMTVFYGVDPSDVRKQSGYFGRAFKKTCSLSTKEEMRRWSLALNHVGNIAGEHSLNWDNEAEMIEKIVRNVSDKLNATPSKDFDGMVGIEAHVRKISSLLCLESNQVRIVGISGPAGIGKTTIARALHSLLSNRFQLTCFIDNLRGSYHNGLDEYCLKLHLQEQLLSKILNQSCMKICHLGAIQERLCDQRVLIILDDVDSLNQLEALANEPSWFGPGSRVIVITENKEILQQYGINHTYHVGFPSREEALMIFSLSAFRKTSPPDGFRKLADQVTRLSGDLPLGLQVLGSSLRGKSHDEWIDVLPRLKNSLDGQIEKVLKVGYESLHEKDQALFLHIAFFFNFQSVDYVKTMLDKTKLNVRLGLKILANKSLIQTIRCSKNRVVMHRLLQQMARQVISKQEPWERQILVDPRQIYYVLENATGNGSILGISFDVSEMDEQLVISPSAFERMCNLVFLKVYSEGSRLYIPEEMDYLPCLRLLHWEEYPRKTLPLRFCQTNLVELHMRYSQLEKLWEGVQPLTSLKKMDLSRSYHLKELPDLSNATNLERLKLNGCWSLVKLPSSIANLHKLKELVMVCCVNLQFLPANINLASLERVNMEGCSRLTTFPDISTNISELLMSRTSLQVEPASFSFWPRLSYVDISNSGSFKILKHVSESVAFLDLSYSGIENIPDCIKGIHGLQHLKLAGCTKIVSLPELPSSLTFLSADSCASLERVTCPSDTPNAKLNFTNCFKLSGEARRKIIQRSFLSGWACLPGNQVPAEFNYRAKGNFLTIHLKGKSVFPASSRFTACVMVSPKQQHTRERCLDLRYCLTGRSGQPIFKNVFWVGLPRGSPGIGTEHLCLFHCDLPEEEIGSEILFEFSCPLTRLEILECGVRINDTENADIICIDGCDESTRLNQVSEVNVGGSDEFEASRDPDNSDGLCDWNSDKVSEEEEDNVKEKEHIYCWSWLFICFSLSH
ncbi:hypothetical protein Bca101_013455 [Brassica carinata]